MIYIINFGSTKTHLISSVITSLGYKNEIVAWDKSEEVDFSNASGIILSGSPTFLTEVSHEPYISRYGFIKKIDIPVLGICFGHQVLGVLYGARIYRGKEVRDSIEISILKEDDLFEGLDKISVFAEDHTEGINLPADFIHLAKSSDYENEAMKHKDKMIYGVQFHPEVSEVNGKKLLKNFCKKCL